MINLHKYIKAKYGQEALNQLQLWEKATIRLSDYKNCRIYTLRCTSNNLVPVGVRLKLTHSKLSQDAGKIKEKAERQLLQDSVRCINKAIEDRGNRINNNKTKLASLVTSAGDLHKCSRFIKEVRGVRFNKVKERQVRKFSNLLVKSRNTLDNNRSAINNIRQVNNTTHPTRGWPWWSWIGRILSTRQRNY